MMWQGSERSDVFSPSLSKPVNSAICSAWKPSLQDQISSYSSNRRLVIMFRFAAIRFVTHDVTKHMSFTQPPKDNCLVFVISAQITVPTIYRPPQCLNRNGQLSYTGSWIAVVTIHPIQDIIHRFR